MHLEHYCAILEHTLKRLSPSNYICSFEVSTSKYGEQYWLNGSGIAKEMCPICDWHFATLVNWSLSRVYFQYSNHNLMSPISISPKKYTQGGSFDYRSVQVTT